MLCCSVVMLVGVLVNIRLLVFSLNSCDSVVRIFDMLCIILFSVVCWCCLLFMFSCSMVFVFIVVVVVGISVDIGVEWLNVLVMFYGWFLVLVIVCRLWWVRFSFML